MEARINRTRLVLVEGDITREETDAVANAANEGLRGGGGVDGAIHRAGGPSIMAECRKIGFCPTGQAVVTTGGDLKAKYVIHTVGPVYRGGTRGEEKLLASCYTECLRQAVSRGLKSIAFPSISTGVYGYPVDEAARVSLGATIAFLKENDALETVRFVLFGKAALEVYEGELRKLL
jgi:O-acetyl-ADP-ribose deacetylase (regulator of RNase III)